MDYSIFPPLNATLNGISTVFIALGWWFILKERKFQHICCMVAALVISTAFLVSYVIYHLGVTHVAFTAEGWIRPVYFTILISHIILAFTIVPLVLATVIPALRARFDTHRKIGRWTMPIWLYVSVTGVLIYFMLYQWFPPDNLQEIFEAAGQRGG